MLGSRLEGLVLSSASEVAGPRSGDLDEDMYEVYEAIVDSLGLDRR